MFCSTYTVCSSPLSIADSADGGQVLAVTGGLDIGSAPKEQRVEAQRASGRAAGEAVGNDKSKPTPDQTELLCKTFEELNIP